MLCAIARYLIFFNPDGFLHYNNAAGDVGNVYFGPNHPMKPHRLSMTHNLVLSYELHKKMEIYVSFQNPHILYQFCSLVGIYSHSFNVYH